MNKKSADILGITSAVLCIVHCLIMPALIIYGVADKQVLAGWEHLDWIFIIISGTAVFIANQHEHQHGLSFAMWFTWLLFAVTLTLHEQHNYFLYTSVATSVALALLHLLHFRKKHLGFGNR